MMKEASSQPTMASSVFVDRPFPETPVTSIGSTVSALNAKFATSCGQSISWRIKQLRRLEKLILENVKPLQTALYSDLGKSAEESSITEIEVVLAETREAIGSLRDWCKTEQVSSPLLLAPAFCELRREPRGTCLIIAPFNYPVSLSLGPLISSIAGGNTSILKPSELCPSVALVLEELVRKYFDQDVVTVVNGGIPQTTALLSHQYGLIFFTGSETVGRIIAAGAAKTTTPVVLELGGKAPLIILDDHPELDAMCNRIVWGKAINSGQTCVAPDYVLCHRKRVDAVLDKMKKVIEEMFGGRQQESKSFGRVVTKRHCERLLSMLTEAENTPGVKVITGGSNLVDVENRFVPTSILLVDPVRHGHLRILKEEIFGGILPVFAVDGEDDAISYIKQAPGVPLALYCFTKSRSKFDKIISACPSGGTCRNDVLVHFATSTLPFGGLGSSGYGSAHGRHGFETFTHKRAVLDKPCHFAFEYNGLRYPPYDKFQAIGGSGKLFASLLRHLPIVPVVSGSLVFNLGVLSGVLLSVLTVGSNVNDTRLLSFAALGDGLIKIGGYLKDL